MIWEKIKAFFASPFTWIASFWTAFVGFFGNFIQNIATSAFAWVSDLFFDAVQLPNDIQFLSWFLDLLAFDVLVSVLTTVLGAYVAAKLARFLIIPLRILLDVL